MKDVEINSLEETKDLAYKIASKLQDTAYICLQGDLGAGKTTFTKSLAKALGIDEVVTSPTFQIMKLYETSDNRQLCHIDAYRLEGIKQDLGFEEIMEDSINVIEWYGYIEDMLPKQRLEIDIELKGDTRIFHINAVGSQYEKMLEEIL